MLSNRDTYDFSAHTADNHHDPYGYPCRNRLGAQLRQSVSIGLARWLPVPVAADRRADVLLIGCHRPEHVHDHKLGRQGVRQSQRVPPGLSSRTSRIHREQDSSLHFRPALLVPSRARAACSY
jgi:hypothetical protein